MSDDVEQGVRELERRGVYDPAAPDAGKRLELLRFLLGLGASVDEIDAARDGLPSVASTVVLRGPGERFSLAEAARRAGVPFETAVRMTRAAGLPDPAGAAVFSDDDVELMRIFAAGSDLLGDDATLQLVRVIGSALARIADAEVAAYLTNVGGPLIEADASGLELARANASAAGLLRAAGRAIDVLLRRHVEVAQRPLLEGPQDTLSIAVGFADLVGSAALAEDLPFRELGHRFAEFEARAVDSIVDAGARAVKFIGDAVMFVAPEPAAACEVALRLVAAFGAHDLLPEIRVGLAFGDVLTRDGDYFGPVVNLAARIVALAGASEVLVAPAVRAALADSTAYAFVARGVHTLRGIREPAELFALERRPASG